MSTYRRLRTKVKQSMKTGSGAEEVYKPDWPFYETMSTFLDDMYNPKKTKSSEDPETTEISEGEQSNVEDEEENSDKPKEGGSFKTPKTMQPKSKKSKLEKELETEKRMDEAYNYLQHISQRPDRDECTLYTELLCKKLRGLKENTRETAMLEIDRYVYNLKRQENLQLETTAQPMSQQPSNYHHAPMQLGLQPASRNQYVANLEPPSNFQQFRFLPHYQHSPHWQPSPSFQETTHSQPSSSHQYSPHWQPSPSFQETTHSQSSSSHQHSPHSQPSPSLQQTSKPQPSPGYQHSQTSASSEQSCGDQQSSELNTFFNSGF